jgi:arsenite methyltransferase
MMPEEKKAFEFDDALAAQLNLLFRTNALEKARKKYFEVFAIAPGELILDLGTGTAANAMALVQHLAGNCQIIGVDTSVSMLAIGEKNLQAFQFPGRIQLQQNDGHDLPFSDNYFDSCMIIQVLEYSKEPVRMLQEARRVLKPGGKLLVVDTDWDTLTWNSVERDQTRRIVLDWSDHEADGWQGRKIQEYLRRAGFQNFRHEVYVINESSFKETDYSSLMTRIVADYLIRAEKMDKQTVERWIDGLRVQDRKGYFYFSLNRYIFVAIKEKLTAL